MSALVAEIAASKDSARIIHDLKSTSFDKKIRYKAKSPEKELSIDIIDGILKLFNRQALQELRRYDNDYEYNECFRPSLGRRDFFIPVTGIITSKFGWRTQFQRIHHGVDLRLNVGDTVRAAISGTVKLISYDANGYGNYVVLSHPDDMETVYGHLKYALVSQGQYVYSGQPLAIGGNTGNSTGPHLHFETRIGGIAVDPTILFDFYGSSNYMYAYDEPKPSIEVAPRGPTYSHQSKSLKNTDRYVVRYGDTLESISRQAGISVMRLCQLNMLSESAPLQVGRMLKLR